MNFWNGSIDPSHRESPIIGIKFYSSLAFTPWIFNPTCVNHFPDLVFIVHLPIVDFCFFIRIALASISSNFSPYIWECTSKKLLLNISSFPVPSLAWKSYNRNLSFKHFALIHDLDNFALIWNISLHRLRAFVFMVF